MLFLPKFLVNNDAWRFAGTSKLIFIAYRFLIFHFFYFAQYKFTAWLHDYHSPNGYFAYWVIFTKFTEAVARRYLKSRCSEKFREMHRNSTQYKPQGRCFLGKFSKNFQSTFFSENIGSTTPLKEDFISFLRYFKLI